MENVDQRTIDGFGREWTAFDQTSLARDEWMACARRYFSLFPFNALPADAEGFDLGCGSGRWAAFVAPKVGKLHCIDPSGPALDVAKRRLAGEGNVAFHRAAADDIPLADSSQDFGYSLGVIHHIPDAQQALGDCVSKLKPGAPFLLYVYYAMENRSRAFRVIWRATDVLRRGICRLPFSLKRPVTTAIAGLVYLPLATLCRLLERTGASVSRVPLNAYRNASFYTMRTDALDRFGTRLEQRFTRQEVEAMMLRAGLTRVQFAESDVFWVAVGWRRHPDAIQLAA